MGLKGEVGYLKEKLLAANQARDMLKERLDELLEDQNSIATEAQNAQVEIDGLKAKLAEQIKKATELEKQVEQLKAVIREVQTKLEQQAAEQQAGKHDTNEPPAPKP
jgi:chromosome segregation ATPase